jgi:hypothetical protein
MEIEAAASTSRGRPGLQELAVIHRTATGFHEEGSTRCVLVPLVGEQGWEDIN